MMNLFSMTKKELQDFLVAQGMKKFRADQIFHYIYKQSVFSWDDMVLLPQKDRDILKEVLPISMPEVVSRLDAPDGRTVKLLLRLEDGQTVETVLMMHDYGNSICVSSQVGCAVNCAFCASAKKRLRPQSVGRRDGDSVTGLPSARHNGSSLHRHHGDRGTAAQLRQRHRLHEAHPRKGYLLLRLPQHDLVDVGHRA